jgi:hypothetical protein
MSYSEIAHTYDNAIGGSATEPREQIKEIEEALKNHDLDVLSWFGEKSKGMWGQGQDGPRLRVSGQRAEEFVDECLDEGIAGVWYRDGENAYLSGQMDEDELQRGQALAQQYGLKVQQKSQRRKGAFEDGTAAWERGAMRNENPHSGADKEQWDRGWVRGEMENQKALVKVQKTFKGCTYTKTIYKAAPMVPQLPETIGEGWTGTAADAERYGFDWRELEDHETGEGFQVDSPVEYRDGSMRLRSKSQKNFVKKQHGSFKYLVST